MYNLKAKLVSLLFKLKPAIKSSVGKHKYQKTLNSFEEHFSEIDTRVNQEKGILAFHRMFLITGLDLYKVLQDVSQNQAELIDIL